MLAWTEGRTPTSRRHSSRTRAREYAWNGNTTVNLVEPASGQTYPVQFDRPTQVGILIQVTTTNGNVQNIIQAILDYAAGAINGLGRYVIGADVSPFEIAGAIMSQYPSYYISSVQISLLSPVSYTTSIIPIGLNQIAYTQTSYITVNIGWRMDYLRIYNKLIRHYKSVISVGYSERHLFCLDA